MGIYDTVEQFLHEPFEEDPTALAVIERAEGKHYMNLETRSFVTPSRSVHSGSSGGSAHSNHSHRFCRGRRLPLEVFHVSPSSDKIRIGEEESGQVQTDGMKLALVTMEAARAQILAFSSSAGKAPWNLFLPTPLSFIAGSAGGNVLLGRNG